MWLQRINVECKKKKKTNVTFSFIQSSRWSDNDGYTFIEKKRWIYNHIFQKENILKIYIKQYEHARTCCCMWRPLARPASVSYTQQVEPKWAMYTSRRQETNQQAGPKTPNRLRGCSRQFLISCRQDLPPSSICAGGKFQGIFYRIFILPRHLSTLEGFVGIF
jgi:hypothetical protein